MHCTAYGFLDHNLREDCATITISFQGVQYFSNAYLSTLREHGVKISVARRSCPWENGYAERLIRTLKEEEVHLNGYEGIHEARPRIGQFITHVYHRNGISTTKLVLTLANFRPK